MKISKINDKDIELNKDSSYLNFNLGDCSIFAEAFYNKFKNDLPNMKLGVIRGRVKMDEYDEYGSSEWEDCHAVIILNKDYYIDSEGLHRFDRKSKEFYFSNDTLKVELIPLYSKKYKMEDYSIYREFDGNMGYPKLEKSIHATFGKITEFDKNKCFDKSKIKKDLIEADLFISNNIEYYKKVINEAKNIKKNKTKTIHQI